MNKSLFRRKVVFGFVLWTATFCLTNGQAVAQVKSQESLKKQEKTGAKEESKKEDKSSVKGLLGVDKGGQAPLFIKSESLNLNSKERVFSYSGNVEIVRGDITITADTVIGKYDEKNQLQLVICKDNVVLTKGEDLRASSNRAVYRVQSAVVEMTEGPELARQGNVLSADKITVYVNEDRSEAEGNVRVKVLKTEEQAEMLKFKEAEKKEKEKAKSEESTEEKEERLDGGTQD